MQQENIPGSVIDRILKVPNPTNPPFDFGRMGRFTRFTAPRARGTQSQLSFAYSRGPYAS